ncbi:hypothetical protein [Burkholderia gladioli]|uniref:hypothetical protein n=1 Tax=Burkholderia gladioli TaxID=28095 RepID=UPI000FD9F188|nr:hypothetical protein [Burkholderia gladioli]MBU9169830.1 hypothetical protein [Burkholderia gladioli]MDC6132228.1 hypothetical protein [Burkholderia gladioli]
MTAHFNEIAPAPRRFFVRISSICPVLGRAARFSAHLDGPLLRIEHACLQNEPFNRESIVSICIRSLGNAPFDRIFLSREASCASPQNAVFKRRLSDPVV